MRFKKDRMPVTLVAWNPTTEIKIVYSDSNDLNVPHQPFAVVLTYHLATHDCFERKYTASNCEIPRLLRL